MKLDDIGYRIQALGYDPAHDLLTSEMTTTSEPEVEVSQKTQPDAQLLLKQKSNIE